MNQAISDVLESKNPKQTAKQVSNRLKTIRDPAQVKKYLQDTIKDEERQFENADAIYAQNKKHPAAIIVEDMAGSSHVKYHEPVKPWVRQEIILQEIKAEKAILRYFK